MSRRVQKWLMNDPWNQEQGSAQWRAGIDVNTTIGSSPDFNFVWTHLQNWLRDKHWFFSAVPRVWSRCFIYFPLYSLFCFFCTSFWIDWWLERYYYQLLFLSELQKKNIVWWNNMHHLKREPRNYRNDFCSFLVFMTSWFTINHKTNGLSTVALIIRRGTFHIFT